MKVSLCYRKLCRNWEQHRSKRSKRYSVTIQAKAESRLGGFAEENCSLLVKVWHSSITMMYKNFGCKKPISCHHPAIADRIYARRQLSCSFQNLSLKMYSEASPCNPVPESGLQKSELRCRPLPIFLYFFCNVGKLPRLSGDSRFALSYLSVHKHDLSRDRTSSQRQKRNPDLGRTGHDL
jgi:hypothetical protein